MATERITIVVREDGSRVVRREIERIGQDADRTVSIVKQLRGALAALGGAALVKELMDLADAFTNITNKLKAAGFEGRTLNAVYDELRAVANRTRASLENTVSSFQRINDATRSLGLSTRDNIQIVETFNQALALGGATTAEAAAAQLQFAQALGSGALRGDELNAILENAPEVAKIIRREFNALTNGELKQLAEQGKITADRIVKAFQAARQEVAERFAKSVPTIGQAFVVLRNNIIDAVGRLDQATGASQALSQAIIALSQNLDQALASMAALAAGATVYFAGTIATALRAATNAVKAFTLALLRNPLGALAVALTTVIVYLTVLRDQLKLGIDGITTLGDLMRAAWESIGPPIQAAIAWIGDLFRTLLSYVGVLVPEVDTSLLGILRAVASTVDTIIGAFRGTAAAIIAAFQALPAAIGSIMIRMANLVLSILTQLVNKMGEQLSSITELVGMGRIGAVDLTINNPFAQAAEDGGRAMVEGFMEGIRGTNFVREFLDNTVSRAQQLAQERERNRQAPPNLDQRGPRAATQGATDGKAAARLQRELDKLISRYDQAAGAVLELARAQDVLTRAVAAGMISQERANQILTIAKAQLEDQIDPLGAINRELNTELELLGMLEDARDTENRFRQIRNDLLRQGVILSEQEAGQLRQRLALIQQENQISQERDNIVANTVGTQQQFMNQVTALSQLLANNSITQAQANQFLATSYQDLFAGTAEAYQAQIAATQNLYAQIDALRQADLISAQTAAQMKARVEAQVMEQRLGHTKSFFGTLAGLSSSGNRKLAAIGKAAAIAQATIDGVLAVQKALASAPPPVNYALAAATGAVAAANVASIASQGITGFATGGSFKVGGNGGTDSQLVAFRATPGEMVDVRRPYHEPREAPQAQVVEPQVSLKVINSIDPKETLAALGSDEGERIILNVIERNPATISRLLNR